MDGNSNTDFKGGYGSCTMSYSTASEHAWWRVDLGQDELVTEVYVVNRLDSDCVCGNRLNDFEIRVGRLKDDLVEIISVSLHAVNHACTHTVCMHIIKARHLKLHYFIFNVITVYRFQQRTYSKVCTVAW